MAESKQMSIIAIGGNSENSFARSATSIRELIKGQNGGELGRRLSGGVRLEIDCTYYSWMGDAQDDTSKFPTDIGYLAGAERITTAEMRKARSANPLIVLGWSNGGDTAYNVAKLMGAHRKIDVLITLDPVSRLTSLHWLPFNGDFERPAGVDAWLNAYPTSWGQTRKRTEIGMPAMESLMPSEISLPALRHVLNVAADEISFRARYSLYGAGQGLSTVGNWVAAIGGAWDSQPYADEDVRIVGNHGDTIEMLDALVRTPSYRKFVQRLARG